MYKMGRKILFTKGGTMRTKEEIEYFIGFCKIVGDDFPIKFLNKYSNSSLQELDLLKQTILQTPKNRTVIVMDVDENITLIGEQKRVALNLIDWLVNNDK